MAKTKTIYEDCDILAGRGMATVWFAAADVAYISGSGLS